MSRKSWFFLIIILIAMGVFGYACFIIGQNTIPKEVYTSDTTKCKADTGYRQIRVPGIHIPGLNAQP